MRNASRVLGIIGSGLAAVFGAFFIVIASALGAFFAGFQNGIDESFSVFLIVYGVLGGIAIASAIHGVIACVLVKQNNKTAGVLNIIAAVLAVPATVSMVLFILAAVFAYREEKPPAPPQVMYAPVPPGAYPPGYPVYYPQPGAYPPPQYPPYGAFPPPPAAPPSGTGQEGR